MKTMQASFTPSESQLSSDDRAAICVLLSWYDGLPQKLPDADEYLNKPSQKKKKIN